MAGVNHYIKETYGIIPAAGAAGRKPNKANRPG